MERRKSNRHSYVKLVAASKDSTRTATTVTVAGSNLRRSRSMRDSIRRLKVKLNHPGGIAPSPFKFNLHVHSRDKHYAKFNDYQDSDQEDRVEQYRRHQLDVESTRVTSEKFFKLSPTHSMDYMMPCDTIEDLMSNLPVPRKACKLLQIPETYCARYLQEQRQEQEEKQQQQRKQQKHRKFLSTSEYVMLNEEDEVENVYSNNHKNHIFEDLSKCMSQGIYGTTRQRTATIRKPMPYLNSSRCPSHVLHVFFLFKCTLTI